MSVAEPSSALSCLSPVRHGSLGCRARAYLFQQCQYSVQINLLNSHCPALGNLAFPLGSPCATSATRPERHWEGKKKEMHWKTKGRKNYTEFQVQITPPGFAAPGLHGKTESPKHKINPQTLTVLLQDIPSHLPSPAPQEKSLAAKWGQQTLSTAVDSRPRGKMG